MKYPLIKLTWLDASTHDRWEEIRTAIDKQDEQVTVNTVGWLLGETKTQYILGTGITGHGCTAATWYIPKGMVTKRTNIKGHDIEH